MPVPWLQIVSLMPSILEVSRELLSRTKRQPAAGGAQARIENPSANPYEARIATLEDNERRQAELVTSMADQLAQLTAAASALHTLTRRLLIGQIATGVVAVVAIVLALR
jgi:hypothetical protein